MTETLTGKQVLALLAQDDVPEIEECGPTTTDWRPLGNWPLNSLRFTEWQFRIKPTPPRRLSVTLASGEVVSWPEPVRGELTLNRDYWYVDYDSEVMASEWDSVRDDKYRLAFGNVHLTREAAQEHADALKKINTQGVTC